MRKAIILFSVFVLISYAGKAQVDTAKKASSDTLTIKPPETTPKNIEQAKVYPDSVNIVQSDTANYAVLYVYRPRNYVGSIISYDLKLTNSFITDYVIGKVKNNSKFEVKLFQEGKTEIYAKTESKRSVFIDVKFGQKYYLKCGISMGVMVGRPELNLIYPEQGELDYENVKGSVK